MTDREIFMNAPVDGPPDRLASYLDGACGDDTDLRARVEALITAKNAAQNGFLERGFDLGSDPTVKSGVNRRGDLSRIDESQGEVIGRYKLLQKIGGGGMGDVWMAEQREPVGRKVALKVIRLGMDTKEVLARFDAERQALAMMNHPNIAQVYDGGSTNKGRPYFVMELVQGVPITKYCDQAKLCTRTRLQLFLQVCGAIQHAHQKGLIHRDIKPSNVMVATHDNLPQAKVIDFGIAKATNQRLTEKTLFTRHGQMVGTPAYMSPEQADFNSEQVDTRADIYSLGVLLYELLTGSTPFAPETLRGAAFDELCRIIREVDPPRPSAKLSTLGESLTTVAQQHQIEPKKFAQSIRGELDWIVMKTLQKQPSRRYGTVAGLSDDIHRYLTDQTVEASPPSVAYGLRKFARRHRGVIAAVSGLIAALMIGLVLTSFQAARARKAEVALNEKVGELEKTKQLLKVALAIKNDQISIRDPLDDPSLEIPEFFQEVALVSPDEKMYLAKAVGRPVTINLPEETGQPSEKGKIAKVIGEVFIVRPGGEREKYTPGTPITRETVIQTGNRSRTEIVFADGSVVRLGSNSVFSFAKGSRDIQLDKGTLLIQSKRFKGDTKVKTAEVTAAITG